MGRRGASAYHVQQAAEKLFKALLVLAGKGFRRTHDLEELAEQTLSAYPQFESEAEAVRHLSDWGTAYRYPGMEEAPDPFPEIADLERSITVLREFRTSVSNLLAAE